MVVQLLGVVGIVLGNVLGFSNLPAILDARRHGSLGKQNALVFPFLCVNCVSQCMYSVAKKVLSSWVCVCVACRPFCTPLSLIFFLIRLFY